MNSAWKKERVFGNERPHSFAKGDSGKLINKDNFNPSASWYSWIRKISSLFKLVQGEMIAK